jgi:hypothetical protein
MLTDTQTPATRHAGHPGIATKTAKAAWGGLLILGAFPVIASIADLAADLRNRIPADHQSAFTALTGFRPAAASAAQPGLSGYIHLLEIGYAVHELVFGVLFLAIVAIPLRRRQRWAWYASWAVLAADLTYTLTFGLHSTTILRQSLIADLATFALLTVIAPTPCADGTETHQSGSFPVARR